MPDWETGDRYFANDLDIFFDRMQLTPQFPFHAMFRALNVF